MENLIKALQIFLKYDNPENPTHCYYELLSIMGDYSKITHDDMLLLEELGFFYDEEEDAFISLKFGGMFSR